MVLMDLSVTERAEQAVEAHLVLNEHLAGLGTMSLPNDACLL